MPERNLKEQLTKYLTDVHSIEEQALTQLRRAPDIAGDPEIAEAFSQHLSETERQERRIRELLEEVDATPSTLKDVAGRAGGMGMLLFAKFQPDTPGKLVAHAYSYEHMELAAYELLRRVAERAGQAGVATVAREIGDEERRMAERLESVFTRAVEASLLEVDPDDLQDQLRKYLADAHAIEAQAIQMLERAEDHRAAGPCPPVRGAPRGDSRPRATSQRPARGDRRLNVAHQGRGHAPRRAQLGRLLPGSARHSGEALRLRLCVRAPGNRGLRAARAGRAAGRR